MNNGSTTGVPSPFSILHVLFVTMNSKCILVFFLVLIFVVCVFINSLSPTGPAVFYKKISCFSYIVSFYQSPLKGSIFKQLETKQPLKT